jgi:hypothetical protein
VSTQVQEQAGSPEKQATKRKRGRETALDMVRSLGLVILVIVPVWFLAKAPASDEAELREVDPTGSIAAYAADRPEVPVPGALPNGWRATSATYAGGSASLRVGWVTPAGEYAEYSAADGDRDDLLQQVAGDEVEQLAPVTVDGEQWQQLREPDGSLSLTRSYGATTVVVGTKRATAELRELEVLLRALAGR